MAFRDLHEISAMFAGLADAFDRRAQWSYSNRPYQRTYVWTKRVDPPAERERVGTEQHTRTRIAAWRREHYDADKRHARWQALKADPVAHGAHLERRRAQHAALDETAREHRREGNRTRAATPAGKASRKAADARYHQSVLRPRYATDRLQVVGERRCPVCGAVWALTKTQKKRGTRFCSRRCTGAFNRAQSLGRVA